MAKQQQIAAAGEISRGERDALIACEAIIERGRKSFCEVAAALLRIRDERLYRASHRTFEDYCRERWEWGRNYVNKQIQTAEVINSLGTRVPKPQTEGQARPLVELRPQDRNIAWEQAVAEAEGEQPSAAKVEAVANTLTQAGRAISRQELKSLRQQILANSSRDALVFRFIEAIETFSRPAMTMRDLAGKILAKDTPERDWRRQASKAQQNLSQLVIELGAATNGAKLADAREAVRVAVRGA